MPDYLLYGAYAMLAIVVVACLAFIGNCFETKTQISNASIARNNER